CGKQHAGFRCKRRYRDYRGFGISFEHGHANRHGDDPGGRSNPVSTPDTGERLRHLYLFFRSGGYSHDYGQLLRRLHLRDIKRHTYLDGDWRILQAYGQRSEGRRERAGFRCKRRYRDYRGFVISFEHGHANRHGDDPGGRSNPVSTLDTGERLRHLYLFFRSGGYSHDYGQLLRRLHLRDIKRHTYLDGDWRILQAYGQQRDGASGEPRQLNGYHYTSEWLQGHRRLDCLKQPSSNEWLFFAAARDRFRERS